MTLTDDLRSAFLTRALSDEQRAELIAVGDETTFARDDHLFREGRPADQLWILLAGEIELTRRIANQTVVITTMSSPGQWAGGLSAWGGDSDGSAVYRATGRAITDGRCLCVPSTNLSELVEKWSPFAKHMITGVYQTVRSIDATARQRESLVALGTLAAGLAHEINNPASAALRATESLRDTTDAMLNSLVALAENGLTAADFLELDRRRFELQQRALTDDGALERADREESIGAWMEARGIDHAWQMAPVLATRGVDRSWLEDLGSVVQFEAVGPSLEWISSAIGSIALLAELTEATTRMSHLVADVKTYTQMDRAALQRVDVRAGLESTLAMLTPKLAGIDVVWTFAGDLPEIEVYAGELNQVWTNLIDNALDAMGHHGTLQLAAFVDGNDVAVEITDSGPGIDPDLLQRVFEPFFTTKDVGKGTGLGLDISRRIVVDRHGGEIEFDSRPGSTTARVRLPIER